MEAFSQMVQQQAMFSQSTYVVWQKNGYFVDFRKWQLSQCHKYNYFKTPWHLSVGYHSIRHAI